MVGLTVKLDRLAAEIDALPLVIDHARQQADTPAPSHQGVPAWQRLGEQLLDDIGQLIRVRRMDKPEALLLSPEQAFFLCGGLEDLERNRKKLEGSSNKDSDG